MVKTRPWDVVNYLQTHEAQTAYLKVVLEDGDRKRIVEAFADVARAKGLQAELLTELQSQMAGGEALAQAEAEAREKFRR